MSLYQALEDRAEVWSRRMPETKRTAYFHLVQYPVQGASQMNKKCLYVQLARHGKADWQLSEQAFDSIVSLTHRYNQGKWQGFMDYKPRNLSVYQRIPKSTTTDSLKSARSYLFKWNGLEAMEGNLLPCEGLGYEGMAAGISKDSSAVFHFDGCPADSVEVELRLLRYIRWLETSCACKFLWMRHSRFLCLIVLMVVVKSGNKMCCPIRLYFV